MAEFRFDAARNGVYKAPQVLEALRLAAVSEAVAWCDLDLAGVGAKKAFLERCAGALKFPDGFGNNWDALADCLEDLSWQPPAGIIVHWHGGSDFARHARDDFFTAIEIFTAACSFWSQRSRIMLVALDRTSCGNGALPVLPPQ